MKRLMIFMMFLFVGTLGLLAQAVTDPENWKDLYDNYEVFLATYLGIAGIASFLGEYVIRLLKLTTKFLKVLSVVLIAIGVSFLASAINIGYLAESAWWETLIWGGLSAAAASGLRSTNLLFVKSVVDFFVGLIKSKEPIE